MLADWLKYLGIGFLVTAMCGVLIWPDKPVGIVWALVAIGCSLAAHNLKEPGTDGQ